MKRSCKVDTHSYKINMKVVFIKVSEKLHLINGKLNVDKKKQYLYFWER